MFSMQRPYYSELEIIFLRAIREGVSVDGKLIADAKAKFAYEYIQKAYENEKDDLNFDFKSFFLTNFEINSYNNEFITETDISIDQHINKLWNVLGRKADEDDEYTSLIPLPYPYIVPGGRFKEIYYWDSYFTMLGLKIHQKLDEIESMIKNFAYLIDQYGYVPNGNRMYYLGRSQPPFFSLMVELLAQEKGEHIYQQFMPQLIKEAEFFGSMNRQRTVNEFQVTIYFDINESPRIEMYLDDVNLAQSIENKAHFYQNIRSACESGWDFSSRWLENSDDLTSIKTQDIAPIDLNCFLYHLEKTISSYCQDEDIKYKFARKTEARKIAILNVFWSEANQCFMDFDLSINKHSKIVSCAMLYPIFVGIATDEQAKLVKVKVEEELLKDGGLSTTNVHTHHQWDAPNGWAPLQWIGVKGLMNYGYNDLALKVALRWTSLNEKVFLQTGKLMEKYNVEDLTLLGGGGEYEVQDGFGWTNGVYLALKKLISA